jgi:hypothetical protein
MSEVLLVQALGDTSSVGMLAYSTWSSRKCSRSYPLADSFLLDVHYRALCLGMVISRYSGVGGGSAAQTQLEGSGGPEDKSKQRVVAFWEFRAPLVSQALLARCPCATKILHQE